LYYAGWFHGNENSAFLLHAFLLYAIFPQVFLTYILLLYIFLPQALWKRSGRIPAGCAEAGLRKRARQKRAGASLVDGIVLQL
jgi:hypothetical protein